MTNKAVPPGPASGVQSQSLEPSQIVPGHKQAIATLTDTLELALVVTAVSVLLALVAVAVAAWLYYWRRALLANPSALVPEQWAGLLRQNTGAVIKAAKGNEAGLNNFEETLGQQSQIIKNLFDTTMMMNRKLDEKDEEIRRLKKGYDGSLFLDFVKRFANVDKEVDFLVESQSITEQDLQRLQLLMSDALEECRVEKFNPDVGTDYRELGQFVADRPKQIKVDDKSRDYQVAAVREACYCLIGPEENTVVIPAVVEIYRSE